MEARKLTTGEERLAGARLIATAFMLDWDEEAERNKAPDKREGEYWGLFDETGVLSASIQTQRAQVAFEGSLVPAGELEMVGSLPERRGGGAVRVLMRSVLDDLKARGDLFALLIPFSFSFYRKFGFELASRELTQNLPVELLQDLDCELAVRRATTKEDAAAMRAVHERFVLRHNLMRQRDANTWKETAYGEFGERSWDEKGRQHYSYVFGGDEPQAYLTFVYVPDPDDPFNVRGTCKIVDYAYDDLRSLRSMLGFVWGLRAKVVAVEIETAEDVDLGLLVGEYDHVKRRLGGHVMARALDVERVLRARRYPQGQTSFSLYVEDAFMPENTGTYAVSVSADGAVEVRRAEAHPDIEMDIQTFTQLAIGMTDLAQELRLEHVTLHANREALERAFVRRRAYATL